jgi:hypothetical protein
MPFADTKAVRCMTVGKFTSHDLGSGPRQGASLSGSPCREFQAIHMAVSPNRINGPSRSDPRKRGSGISGSALLFTRSYYGPTVPLAHGGQLPSHKSGLATTTK